ncbi:MAG: PQQ-binding-like beta-propeller repeat protein [Actinobacteria bacterium]|nr:PQQ-binding-like beta-propeller repeat protein [Actinomycetota bacterium]
MMFHKLKLPFIRFLAVLVLTGLIFGASLGCGSKKETGSGSETDGDARTGLAWPAGYRDNQRSGLSPYSGPGASAVLWQYEAGAVSFAWSVLARDGKVLSGLNGKVVCLNPEDGTAAWEFETAGSSAGTCRVKDDGTIYVSAGNNVYALSPKGQEQWSYDMGSEADEPSLASDGTVYVGSVGGKLAALSSDGKLEWEHKVPGNIRSPSIDEDGNLYCSASPLALYMIDKKGKQKWEFKPEGELPMYEGLFSWANTFDYPSIADDGTIYVGSFVTPGVTSSGQWIEGYSIPDQGKLYAVTPDGQKKWEYFRPDGKFTIHSPTIGADGTLYVGTSCYRVIALDPNGSVIWEFFTNEGQGVCPSVYSPPIGKDGLLYAATTSGKIFCITPEGTELWRFAAENPWMPDMSRSNNFTPPAIGGNGVIFSTLAQGRIYAFGAPGAAK